MEEVQVSTLHHHLTMNNFKGDKKYVQIMVGWVDRALGFLHTPIVCNILN